jgi:hypothetical protein
MLTQQDVAALKLLFETAGFPTEVALLDDMPGCIGAHNFIIRKEERTRGTRHFMRPSKTYFDAYVIETPASDEGRGQPRREYGAGRDVVECGVMIAEFLFSQKLHQQFIQVYSQQQVAALANRMGVNAEAPPPPPPVAGSIDDSGEV